MDFSIGLGLNARRPALALALVIVGAVFARVLIGNDALLLVQQPDPVQRPALGRTFFSSRFLFSSGRVFGGSGQGATGQSQSGKSREEG